MKRLTSIVAMNHERFIGAGNRLPWRLRSDLQFFKNQTLNNVVIMGRRTFDSLGKRPLPNRINIILTHSFDLIPQSDQCKAASSVEAGLWLAQKECQKSRSDCFVIGGASMYTQFSPFVDRYLVTLVDKKVPGADTRFEESLLQDAKNWDINVVGSKRADGIEDEADFTIFELISSNSRPIADRRTTAIAEIKSAAGAAGARRNASYRRRHVPVNEATAALI